MKLHETPYETKVITLQFFRLEFNFYKNKHSMNHEAKIHQKYIRTKYVSPPPYSTFKNQNKTEAET